MKSTLFILFVFVFSFSACERVHQGDAAIDNPSIIQDSTTTDGTNTTTDDTSTTTVTTTTTTSTTSITTSATSTRSTSTSTSITPSTSSTTPTSSTTTITSTTTIPTNPCVAMNKDLNLIYDSWFAGKIENDEFMLKLQDRVYNSKICYCEEVPYINDVKKVVSKLLYDKQDAVDKLANVCESTGSDINKVRDFLNSFYGKEILSKVDEKFLLSVLCRDQLCPSSAVIKSK
ncbi:MAG: hypothetical protein WCQ47_05825 [bacterium]